MEDDSYNNNTEASEPKPKKFKSDIVESAVTAEESLSNCEAPVKPSPNVSYNSPIAGVQTEASVGITQFLSNLPGFTGILKHRYSDFLVNEINLQKEVAQLTNLNKLPEENIEKSMELSDVFTEDVTKQLKDLSQGDSSSDVEIQVTNLDKVERTKYHHCIRQNFTNLKSFTKKVGEENFIVVQTVKQGKRGSERWPDSRPNYIHFILYKENTDTMDATRTIASCLKMNPNSFTYAGTKDKRAKTCQWVSAYRVYAEKLLRLNNCLKSIKVGNIMYKDQAINLGDLFGNKFTVILRNVSKTGSEVDNVMKEFSEKGFINYFGLQRFGTTSVPTHAIGRSLISEDWEKAVQLILEPRGSTEPKDMQECRRIWWESRDAQRALNALHRKNCIEGILLKGLATHAAKDFLNALNMIPRNTRLLYLHSFQSYIWNCIVSMRINKMGLTPVEGDLYIENTGEKDISNKEPEVVTAEVLKSGKITLYDIVLPLPGYSVQYPRNEVESWYKDMLEKEGLNLNSFKTKVKEYSLGGCYRYMLVKPEDVSWVEVKYSDDNETLVASDYDRLIPGFQLNCPINGTKIALKLEFSLPSSAYATMAVREIMKMETTAMVDKGTALTQIP